MALGTNGLKPAEGDVIKVISGKYPSIPKGTIAVVIYISKFVGNCLIDGHTDVPVNVADLEVVACKEPARRNILLQVMHR